MSNNFFNDFSGFGYSGVPIWFMVIFFGIFGLIFFLIIGTVIYSIVDRAKDRRKPVIPVQATVVGKRTDVWGHEHTNTTYYVTFLLINGERIELMVPDRKAGLILEGDEGVLLFQGKLFVDFQPKI